MSLILVDEIKEHTSGAGIIVSNTVSFGDALTVTGGGVHSASGASYKGFGAGIAPENWHGFRIGGQPLTPFGGTTYGFISDHTLPNTPSNSHGFATFIRTPAAAGNWGTHFGYRVGAFVLGAGSAINSIIGVEIDPTTTVCSTAIGIRIGAMSGGTIDNQGILIGDVSGTGAFAIKTGLGPVQFGDRVTVDTVGSAVIIAVNVVGAVTSNGTTAKSMHLNQTVTAGANGETLRGLHINEIFATGGFTGVTVLGLEIAAVTTGATNYAIRTGLGLVEFGDNVNIASGKVYKVNATQVVAARVTGWAAATGTKSRATFVTDTETLPNVAARVGALIDDLISHGLIGA